MQATREPMMSDLPDRLPALVASAAASDYYQPTLDVGRSPLNVPSTRLQAALAEQRYPFAMSREFMSDTSWGSLTEFLDQGTDGVSFEANGRSSNAALASADTMMVVVENEFGYSNLWTVTVAADTRKTARRWMSALAELLPAPIPPPPPELPHNVVPVRFWMQDPYSKEAYSRHRNITVHPWADVEANYSADVRKTLGELVGLPEPKGGKLILMHGEPGTGKTRAVLSLISEWRDWCSASVVTDTDRFFGDPTYLNSLVFNAEGMNRWLLLVLEDADEFINVQGRETKGQSISRLLNLADGIVGQGLNLLTLMTTNVAVDELNPAITRSGRCLANVHVGPFPAEEGQAWLSDRGVKGATLSAPITLADLYARLPK